MRQNHGCMTAHTWQFRVRRWRNHDVERLFKRLTGRTSDFSTGHHGREIVETSIHYCTRCWLTFVAVLERRHSDAKIDTRISHPLRNILGRRDDNFRYEKYVARINVNTLAKNSTNSKQLNLFRAILNDFITAWLDSWPHSSQQPESPLENHAYRQPVCHRIYDLSVYIIETPVFDEAF